jgi:signal transduction histidine kinase
VVALVVSALVGVGVAATLLIVGLTSQRPIQSDVDAQLEQRLHTFEANGLRLTQELRRPQPPQRPADLLPAVGRIAWVFGSDGSLAGSMGAAPDLPAQYQHVSAPTDAVIAGYRYRLAGAAVGDRWVVVGQLTEGLDLSRPVVVWPPWWVLPPAVVGVFLVSLLIGRWAAQPIARARRQQLAFTANASHELRTPLAVVEGEVSLALTRERTIDEYRATLARVSRETLELRRLVDDLLWLAVFESEPRASRQPGSEPVDLAEAGQRSLDRFQALAEQRGLRLRLVASGEPALLTPADWIDRLIGVLLDNACRYTPRGGEVCLTVIEETDRVELYVDDSGPGIPVAERERVFQRFQRASSNGDGAGLGLSIAAAVVRATGGGWTVATSPLGGARMGISWRTGGRRPRAL